MKIWKWPKLKELSYTSVSNHTWSFYANESVMNPEKDGLWLISDLHKCHVIDSKMNCRGASTPGQIHSCTPSAGWDRTITACYFYPHCRSMLMHRGLRMMDELHCVFSSWRNSVLLQNSSASWCLSMSLCTTLMQHFGQHLWRFMYMLNTWEWVYSTVCNALVYHQYRAYDVVQTA